MVKVSEDEMIIQFESWLILTKDYVPNRNSFDVVYSVVNFEGYDNTMVFDTDFGEYVLMYYVEFDKYVEHEEHKIEVEDQIIIDGYVFNIFPLN